MLWEIEAVENLKSGDFVEFVGDLKSGNLCCKKAVKPESIAAIAARNIVRGEVLTYDTEGDNKDLVRLQDPLSRP
jgi:hypothetical protein